MIHGCSAIEFYKTVGVTVSRTPMDYLIYVLSEAGRDRVFILILIYVEVR
jgi:hypothetical protein